MTKPAPRFPEPDIDANILSPRRGMDQTTFDGILLGLTDWDLAGARGLLEWSQAELAEQSNLGQSTIRNFEKGRRLPSINDLAAIRAAFEAAGVLFVE